MRTQRCPIIAIQCTDKKKIELIMNRHNVENYDPSQFYLHSDVVSIDQLDKKLKNEVIMYWHLIGAPTGIPQNEVIKK